MSHASLISNVCTFSRDPYLLNTYKGERVSVTQISSRFLPECFPLPRQSHRITVDTVRRIYIRRKSHCIFIFLFFIFLFFYFIFLHMTLMDSLNNLMYMTQQSYEAVTIRWDDIEWVKLLVGTYGSQYMHVPSALLPYIFHIFGGGTRREPYPTTSLEALILLVVTFFSFLVSLFYFIK